jgi:hypothetical protein
MPEETPIDHAGVMKASVGGRTTLGLDDRAVDKVVAGITKITGAYEKLRTAASGAARAMSSGGRGMTTSGTTSGAGGTSVAASMSSSLSAIPSVGGGGGGTPPTPGGGGGGGGGGGTIGNNAMNTINAGMKPIGDAMSAIGARVERGAQYSLQADRMSVQLQQMYGMSNKQVRNQLRKPLTEHYLLGGGTAINDLLGMQASTGLSAEKNASTVESLRTVSGFSYGSGDITKMLSTMGSPDVANKMFMMGGTGMYGIGGKQRSGMQSIQDIVRRTGLTNPDALKGALQQGSNTRQRLDAMGVPQDMQDLVIQYAMQNNSFQKKSGKNVMYDPSVQEDREAMGIEGTYAVQHEQTTGARVKREEQFYGRQTDNFAQFEKNLRTTTQLFGQLEDALSSVIGLYISTKGHPVTEGLKYGVGTGINFGKNAAVTAFDLAGLAAGGGPGGDAVDSKQKSVSPTTTAPTKGSTADAGPAGAEQNVKKLSKNNEDKLATLDPKLAIPLRRVLEANSSLRIGDAVRSNAEQTRGFLSRYYKTDKPQSEKSETGRIWNGDVWEMKNTKDYPMAPPGQSMHERGLAADVVGDDNWLRANASKYGLSHGGTQPGAQSDEPFHLQPAGTMGSMYGGGNSVSKSGKSSGVSKSSVAKLNVFSKTGISTSKVSMAPLTSAVGGAAGSIKSYIEKGGLKSEGSIVGNTDKISSLSLGASAVVRGKGTNSSGDPVDYQPSLSQGMAPQQSAPAQGSSQSGQAAGSTITISPNIYLNGSQDMSTDLRRIAREVGSLLEQEVKLKMMRTS